MDEIDLDEKLSSGLLTEGTQKSYSVYLRKFPALLPATLKNACATFGYCLRFYDRPTLAVSMALDVCIMIIKFNKLQYQSRSGLLS